MQYLKVILVACQVWSKVKLLHALFGGYLNHVRQALNALPKIKHVVFYNAMQGTTQAHFLVKLLKSSTLSSFLNQQNIASSSGLVKISTNWSSVHTPSNEISFFATWSLRSDGGYLCAWCESVEPDYLQVLPHFHCRIKEVLFSRTTP